MIRMTMANRLRGLVAVALLAPALASAESPEFNSTYRLHVGAKPAVVRIIDGYTGHIRFADGRKVSLSTTSSGSGFFVSPDGYIMTNAHVVEGTKSGQEAAAATMKVDFLRRLAKQNDLPPTKENLLKVAEFAEKNGAEFIPGEHMNKVLLQDGSALPFEIKSFGAPIGDEGNLVGKDVAIIKVEIKNAPTLRLGDSANVKVGDHIFVIGYPGAADSSMLDDKSSVEPTTNDGSISAVKTTRDGIPVLQTNANTTHGNSGGPVLNQVGEVIGLLTFRGNLVNGQEVQGFNFIVPSNTAREFLSSAGAANTPGIVDQRWQAGLKFYWQAHYKDAKTHFDEVATLFPRHAEAKRLITDSQERILKGEDQSANVSTLIYGIAGLGIVLGGVVGGVVIVRRRAGTAGVAPVRVVAPRRSPSAPNPPAAGDDNATLVALPQSGPLPITFQSGPLKGQRIQISPHGSYLGRDAAKADVVVVHEMISGRHLWIGQQAGQWMVIDQGSTNGTFVNEAARGRIKEQALRPGDLVLLAPDAAVSFMVG